MAPASRAACFEAGTCYALWAISDDKWADPVLNYVLTQSDQYPFGEERRPFSYTPLPLPTSEIV